MLFGRTKACQGKKSAKLNWTKRLGKGVSYYVAAVNKVEVDTLGTDFIIYKVMLNVNILRTLVKLWVLSECY